MKHFPFGTFRLHIHPGGKLVVGLLRVMTVCLRYPTTDNCKWPRVPLSRLQARGHLNATSATPPSRGRTRSTCTSRWFTTATKSTSVTCARRPSSLRLCWRATKRWIKTSIVGCFCLPGHKLQKAVITTVFFFLEFLPSSYFYISTLKAQSSKSTLPQSIICYHPEFKMGETPTCFSIVFSLAELLQPWSSTCALKRWQSRSVDHRCPRRSANRLLCWLEMALCLLAPRGSKTWKRSHCWLRTTEPDGVRRGCGSRLESNGFLAQRKRKCLRGCPRTVGQVSMFNLTGFFFFFF